ncbi:MAG: hypothetical protein ACI9OJ_002170 [Myxococcota bacterium]|jgi:hypothetical protein
MPQEYSTTENVSSGGSGNANTTRGERRNSASGQGYAAQAASLSPSARRPQATPPAAVSASTGWSTVVRRNFSAWDSNSDGYLGHGEVNTLLGSPAIRGEDAAALASLQTYIDGLEESSNDEYGDENDGVTLADLTAYERGTAANTNGEDTKHVDGRHGMGVANIAAADQVKRRHGGAQATRHSTELFPNGTPTLSELRQGSMGDCYFLAALGSMIARNAQDVVDMVTRNVTRGAVTGYTVVWPGDLATVTVSSPTDSEIARFSTAGADGLWLPILEKAYAQARAGRTVNAGTEIGDGGALSEGIDPLSANGTDSDDLWATSLSTTRTKLTAAFGPNRKIVTGNLSDEDNDLHLPGGHAYSVIGWDGTWMTLRNPWGSTPANVPAKATGFQKLTGGQFKMTLSKFDDVFFQIAYAE